MSYIVSTLAGTPQSIGDRDGLGDKASFYTPCGICVDGDGFVYVSDHNNNKIRKITPDGLVTTLAGKGTSGYRDSDDPLEALFSQPSGICVDSQKNVYVADFSSHKVRKITPSGKVTTIGKNISYSSPLGTGVDSEGNVFVADRNNGRVVKITNDIAVSIAVVYEPYGLCVSKLGNIYVSNTDGIHKISPTKEGNNVTGYQITKYRSSLGFGFVLGVDVDENENVFVCDSTANKIKKINLDGTVEIIAGTGFSGYLDGPADVAHFKQPWGVAVDKFGCIYVSGWHNQVIRKIVPSDELAIKWPESHNRLFEDCQIAIETLLLVIGKTLPKEIFPLIVQKLIKRWLRGQMKK